MGGAIYPWMALSILLVATLFRKDVFPWAEPGSGKR
jgi:hypothetical protein